jgi:hypothetical protein
MKNLFPIILLILISSKIQGQDFNPIQKGNILIGGTVSASYEQKERLEYLNTYDLEIHPTFGYFICNKFVLGLNPSSSITWTRENTLNPYEKKVDFGISPMFRYYPWKKLFISFEPGFIVGHIKSGQVDSKTTGYSFNQGIGYDIFLNRNIAIELGYYYYYAREKVDEIYENQFPFVTDLITNRFKINIGLQIII